MKKKNDIIESQYQYKHYELMPVFTCTNQVSE